MKKGDMSVTMPMTAYEELASYKEKFLELRARIAGLADTKSFDFGYAAEIYVSADKVRALCRECMSSRYKTVSMVIS